MIAGCGGSTTVVQKPTATSTTPAQTKTHTTEASTSEDVDSPALGTTTSGNVGSLSSSGVGSLGKGSSGSGTIGSSTIPGLTKGGTGSTQDGGSSTDTNTTTTPTTSTTTNSSKKKSQTTTTTTVTHSSLPTVVIHYVYLRPNLPAGGLLPTLKVVSHPVFTVAGRNIVCSLGLASVSCGVRSRSWTVPGTHCEQGWAAGVNLNGAAQPSAFCEQGSVEVPADAPTVTAGYDDAVGNTLCEVRTFGVDCFVVHHHGFLISRTGYLLY